jgi:transcriptional regulator with XRE-family HTH domain
MESDEVKLRFGKGLAHWRRFRELSQDELARRTNISRSHIGAIESGQANPTLCQMSRLAQALGVTLAGVCAEGRL